MLKIKVNHNEEKKNAGEFLIGVLENKNGYFIQHKA